MPIIEAGFADAPDDVAANVVLAVEAGVSGLSIEDQNRRQSSIRWTVAVARIRASKAAIARSGEDVVLVGRSEGFLIGNTDLAATVARLVAYADAGADCLYAPGVTDP